jgi:NAD(P)-dependent dehydrogenase (short-subunit alcohol dehydrogenase family)
MALPAADTGRKEALAGAIQAVRSGADHASTANIGLTETLRDEVAPFGIRTLIVEPGAFRTGLFRPGAAYESAEMPEYADTVGPTREYVRHNHGRQPGDPAKAAQAILAALDADEPPLRLVLGDDALGNIRSRPARLSDELATWEEVAARSTAVEDP